MCSSSTLYTINLQPTANNDQLSHLRWGLDVNPDLRGGRQVYYHNVTTPSEFHAESIAFTALPKTESM